MRARFSFPLKLWMLFHPDQQKKWTFSNQFELTNGENLPGTVAFISECHDTAGDPAKSSSRKKFSPKENKKQAEKNKHQNRKNIFLTFSSWLNAINSSHFKRWQDTGKEQKAPRSARGQHRKGKRERMESLFKLLIWLNELDKFAIVVCCFVSFWPEVKCWRFHERF